MAVSATALCGKDKHRKAPEARQDQIELVAHISLAGGPITRFLVTQHYRQDYLYAEHESSRAVTLIDVTNTSQPRLLADVAYPQGEADNLVAVTGNAVLATNAANTPSAAPAPQTFRIMNFANPLHPEVKQQFDNVTAIARDEKRGLIFLANSDGLWILRQDFAISPEDEKFQKELEHTIFDTP